MDNRIRSRPSARAGHEATERGNITLPLLILVAAFILFVGLVVDGSGQVQAGDRASQLAQSAARAATNSLTGEAIATGGLQLDPVRARTVALAYLTGPGVSGDATVTGNTVTVDVTVQYTTIFLSIIGINALDGSGTASAQLIDG
jgi:Flp pilus assembly protein TadG